VNFRDDMMRGNKAEELVKRTLETGGIECEFEKENNPHHDLKCKVGRTKFTCEIKFDSMAEKTGNMAIEFRNSVSDKPSGLYSTLADLWVVVIPDGTNRIILCISVEKFKKFIADTEPRRTILACGDGNADIHLYEIDRVIDQFTRIDNIPAEALVKTIRKVLKDNT
jgi:hypothetical protein